MADTNVNKPAQVETDTFVLTAKFRQSSPLYFDLIWEIKPGFDGKLEIGLDMPELKELARKLIPMTKNFRKGMAADIFKEYDNTQTILSDLDKGIAQLERGEVPCYDYRVQLPDVAQHIHVHVNQHDDRDFYAEVCYDDETNYILRDIRVTGKADLRRSNRRWNNDRVAVRSRLYTRRWEAYGDEYYEEWMPRNDPRGDFHDAIVSDPRMREGA
jgi:hypothetical protein